MKKYLRCFAFFFIFFQSAALLATHNRAGEIVVEQIGGCTSNTVRATVITYTKTSSIAADRDSVTICWGDGTCTLVARGNGNGQPLPNDIKYNFYTTTHIYDGPGRYSISMTDPNRNGGIINVNPPGSENVQFHLQTTFTLFGGQNQGCNNSPVLLQPPIDYACVGETFVHNPGAYDPDGDSLSYELIIPLQDVGTPVPNYTFPPNVPGASGCCLSINELTGTLTWNVPEVQGEYNVAMIIISWRNGMPLDTTIRDMQILVFDCDDNRAPEIQTETEICVIAGEMVEFTVTATDPDAGDMIKLSALGAPFILEVSPASDIEIWRPQGDPSAVYEDQPVVKTFRWQTACEHISDLPYTVVFKAEDDFFLQNVPGSTGLATLKAVRIKVVGPPPLDVQAAPSSDRITVSWESPYKCEAAEEELFFGFSVWRKEGNDNFQVDTCMPGLDGSGYTQIAITIDQVAGRYQYVDLDVERGRTYCYRILGRFARRSDTGQPYNLVESLASEKACVQLSRDVPLITNVSVEETANSNGAISVKWIKPVADDLDTLLNPGPYRYDLRRVRGIANTGFETIATFTSPTYWQLTDTSYFDQEPILDTEGAPYTYQLSFYVNGETTPLGFSPSASSVYLEISPTDNQNDLSWRFEVPWVNEKYDVFRWNDGLAQWDLIATAVQDTFYSDKNLLNGREYCYYVKAYGSYGIDGIPSPLINLSQEACAVPLDNVPPCPPELTVRNICDENRTCQEDEVLENRLNWVNPMDICEETDDVVSYNIYFAGIQGEDFVLIGSIDDSGETTFFHQPERGIAGCYAVTALDTFANESAFSEIICVDNCPNFSLPNAFTPNDDGANDQYIPFPFCFIESIEMTIFNRWGQLVYETNDPNINWNGQNLNGKQLPAGTYYYTCKIFEQRVSGTVESPEVLKGYIDLIR